MKQKEMLYEGKAKQVFATDDKSVDVRMTPKSKMKLNINKYDPGITEITELNDDNPIQIAFTSYKDSTIMNQ